MLQRSVRTKTGGRADPSSLYSRFSCHESRDQPSQEVQDAVLEASRNHANRHHNGQVIDVVTCKRKLIRVGTHAQTRSQVDTRSFEKVVVVERSRGSGVGLLGKSGDGWGAEAGGERYRCGDGSWYVANAHKEVVLK